MNKKLLEILACPIDKHHPLEMYECVTKKDIIIEGILYCTKCSRFFPIIDEIPIMLPDDLRDEETEKKFLEKNIKKLPDTLISQAKPWHV